MSAAAVRWRWQPAPSCRWPCSAQPGPALLRGPTRRAFDSGRAFEHVRQLVAIGPRPAGSAGAVQARRYITSATVRPGPDGRRAVVCRADAAGARADGQRGRAHSRGARRAADPRRPLRHEAVSRLPLRRRQRRRIEHGDAARTGARAEGAPERLHDRAGVLRRRGGGDRVDGRRPHLRQPPLRRRRAARRLDCGPCGRWCCSTWSATAS